MAFVGKYGDKVVSAYYRVEIYKNHPLASRVVARFHVFNDAATAAQAKTDSSVEPLTRKLFFFEKDEGQSDLKKQAYMVAKRQVEYKGLADA